MPYPAAKVSSIVLKFWRIHINVWIGNINIDENNTLGYVVIFNIKNRTLFFTKSRHYLQ